MFCVEYVVIARESNLQCFRNKEVLTALAQYASNRIILTYKKITKQKIWDIHIRVNSDCTRSIMRLFNQLEITSCVGSCFIFLVHDTILQQSIPILRNRPGAEKDKDHLSC